MSCPRRYIVVIFVVSAVAVGGWALAQSERPAPMAEGLSFAIGPAGGTAVLLDTKSGKTWFCTIP
jgi:hypothetical protein